MVSAWVLRKKAMNSFFTGWAAEVWHAMSRTCSATVFILSCILMFDARGAAEAATQHSSNGTALPVAVDRVISGYISAVNAGKTEKALAYYAPDATIRLSTGQIARGRAALRDVEEFHAAVRSRQLLTGPSYRTEGSRTYVTFARAREYSTIFDAVDVPFLTTEPAIDAFVVEHEQIVAIQPPKFIAPCRELMAEAVMTVRKWLEGRADVRLKMLVPGGIPKIDGSTGAVWVNVLTEWRAASHWMPDPTKRAACATL